MTALFITGTDTGIGKTFVGCGLAAFFSARGVSVGVMKPVETGCDVRDGQLYPADADRLRRFSGTDLPLEMVCPYRFEPPVAPAVAAGLAGSRVDTDRLARVFGQIERSHEVTLVEGAGGLLAPVDGRYTFADLVKELGIPVLVVVGSKLGAINHALLTLRCARFLGLSVSGYIVNHPFPQSDLATRTNAEILARLADAPCRGTLPYVSLSGDDDDDRHMLASLVKRSLDFGDVLG